MSPISRRLRFPLGQFGKYKGKTETHFNSLFLSSVSHRDIPSSAGSRLTTRDLLNTHIATAMREVFGDKAPVDALVSVPPKVVFGDYQSTVSMSFAKQIGKSPHEVASQIKNQIPPNDMISEVTASGI